VSASVGILHHEAGAEDRRRMIAVDVAIVASCAAGFAHLVAAPGHYTWWPTSGVFFAVLGIAQLGHAAMLQLGCRGRLVVLAGIWVTVGVILVYVASRTVGIPTAPPVPAHGGRWSIGRSIVPDGAKHVGPLDVLTLVAELVQVVVLMTMLPAASKRRATNQLMWIGLGLWGAAVVAVLRF